MAATPQQDLDQWESPTLATCRKIAPLVVLTAWLAISCAGLLPHIWHYGIDSLVTR